MAHHKRYHQRLTNTFPDLRGVSGAFRRIIHDYSPPTPFCRVHLMIRRSKGEKLVRVAHIIELTRSSVEYVDSLKSQHPNDKL